MSFAAAAVRPAGRLRQRDFIVLALYWVAIGYLWQSLGTLILPDAVRDLVGDAAKGRALSLLEGIGTVVAVVWQPVAGALSDRTRSRWGRRRPFIVAGTLGDLVFLAGLALSGSFWPLVVFYTLLQLASNTAQGPYQGLAPDVVPEAQRGAASGYYGLANLAGVLAGTAGAGLILAAAGRAAALASIAAMLALTMLVTVSSVPETAGAGPDPSAAPRLPLQAAFLEPLRHHDFRWLMASRLLVLMGIVGIQSFALFFFSDAFFHGEAQAGTVATAALVGLVVLLAIVVTWPAARLSDRLGRRALILAGGTFASAGLLVLLGSGRRWLPEGLLAPVAALLRVPELAAQTLGAGVLLGVGFGAFLSVDWAYLTDVIPAAQAGLYFGFANIATAGAGVIARFVAGFLLDAFNAGPRLLGLPGGYPVIFGLFLAFVVTGTLCVLPIRAGRRA